MKNIYILSEERPKASVVYQLLLLVRSHWNIKPLSEKEILITNNKKNNIKIVPEINKGRFTFNYLVKGIDIEGIDNIVIKLSKGYSSFVDFLVFVQDHAPNPESENNLIFGVEETKTRDSESRNTGVYQRGSKFVFFEYFYPNTKLYMLYNDSNEDSKVKPSETSIFGTNLYKNLDVTLLGKDEKWFTAFKSIEDMIAFKSSMRKPPKGNVPVDIKLYKNKNLITISGRLAKPANAGNIGHDPNIGALTLISAALRKLEWSGKIVITKHGVSQSYINRNKKNKFLLLCSILNIELEGISMDLQEIKEYMPSHYWKYENSSEKVTDIFLHLLCEYHNIPAIYENHAGSERGYFITKNQNIVIPKKNKLKQLYYIPDVVIANHQEKELLLIEGKTYVNWRNGIKELENYPTFEDDFLNKYYPDYKFSKWVTLYSPNKQKDLPHKDILLNINNLGEINYSDYSPNWLKKIMKAMT
ncbi:hypothetical protein ACLIJS_11810 [Mammaliicoccus sciuri]|uniref:hypothetical protein n=1 Tax=Mammaliicoccus sciuri TaxID=1296 RepID=UPI00194F50D5|nr:hypothetical protein [Mammaliicoccus sciuri]MEB7465719.1 hypothetical protein [Mammaliicoccus sciuri]